MTEIKKPTKASDGPLILQGQGPEVDGVKTDVFIAAPLPQLEQHPEAGAKVLYLPSPRAPQGPGGNLHVEESARPMDAVIDGVHGPRLVDLQVVDHKGVTRGVRFVPLVHDGDPDPGSPCGRCFWPKAEG